MALTSGGQCSFWCWMFRMSLRRQNQMFASNNAVVFPYCCRQIDTPLSPLFRADSPAVLFPETPWDLHRGYAPTHTSELLMSLTLHAGAATSVQKLKAITGKGKCTGYQSGLGCGLEVIRLGWFHWDSPQEYTKGTGTVIPWCN